MGLVAFVGYVSRLQLAFPAQFACYLTAVARSPYVAQGRTPCDDNYRVAKNDKSDSNRIWFVHPLAVTAFEEMEIPSNPFGRDCSWAHVDRILIAMQFRSSDDKHQGYVVGCLAWWSRLYICLWPGFGPCSIPIPSFPLSLEHELLFGRHCYTEAFTPTQLQRTKTVGIINGRVELVKLHVLYILAINYNLQRSWNEGEFVMGVGKYCNILFYRWW